MTNIWGINCELIPRNSKDMKIINRRGNDLLDICRINDLCVVNGRTLGDLFGRFTCHQKNGSRVVDYLITLYRSINNIINFAVGNFYPKLPDHCPIVASIHLTSSVNTESKLIPELQDIPRRFKWNDEQRRSFSEMLKSNDVEIKVDRIM